MEIEIEKDQRGDGACCGLENICGNRDGESPARKQALVVTTMTFLLCRYSRSRPEDTAFGCDAADWVVSQLCLCRFYQLENGIQCKME